MIYRLNKVPSTCIFGKSRNLEQAYFLIIPPSSLSFFLPIHEKWSLPASLVSLALVRKPLILSFSFNTVLFVLGANREVKKAVEAYWAGKISADDLTKAAADVKKTSWTSVKAHGVDFIPRYGSSSIL